MMRVKLWPMVEEVPAALQFLIFMIIAFLIFSKNSSCLFYGMDGSYWASTLNLPSISRTPFTQLGADPVQGNFDAYLPTFREYLLPYAIVRPFTAMKPNDATIYTIYAGLMILSLYLLARALHLDRAPALFGSFLYP